jgi:hypothetical protein
MTYATFAAGPYTATYNTDAAPGSPAGKGAGGRDLGLVEGVRRWRRIAQAVPVKAAAFGSSTIDGIYTGSECFCEMTLKEWSAAVRDCLWPYDDAPGNSGPIGRLLSDLAGELVLTAVDDTPAATNGPAVLTFGKAIIAPGHETEVPLGDFPRDVKLVFRCYPYVTTSGDVAWFEET